MYSGKSTLSGHTNSNRGKNPLRKPSLSIPEVIYPVKRNALNGKVIQQIREFIENAGLQSGMRLPSERELAARLKVSRPSAREAIKVLSMLDVLESRHGDGTYLKSADALHVEGPLKISTVGPSFDMIQLLEIRKIIEPRAAGLAAARATAKQLREIEKDLLIQEAQPNDYRVLELPDYHFHNAIIAAAGNQLLIEVARVLSPHLLKTLQFTAHTTPDVPKVIRQHRTIFEAIRVRESDLAEQAMKDHLQTVGMDIVSERKR